MQWECDKLLEHPDPCHMDPKELKERTFRAIKQAFEHHYKNCLEYRRYSDLHDVKPEDLKRYEDLVKIQPIPSDVFRDVEKPIISVPEGEIIFMSTTSSTTSKKPVKFLMDKISLQRVNIANKRSFYDVLEMRGNGSIFFLTPSPEESDTGLVKGMYLSVKALGFEDDRIKFMVKGTKLDCEYIMKEIPTCDRPIYLFGPPFAVVKMVRYLEDKSMELELDENSKILTSGGWKTVKDDVTRDEFDERVSKVFRIKREQIRDMLGLTDIFTGLPECQYHKKHVSPWYHISVRSPKNLNEEVTEGEKGLLIYMSSLIRSYPAFCMPGDMGAVWEKECKCGRTGQIVEHLGRAKGAGARGCAIRLEEFMEMITKK